METNKVNLTQVLAKIQRLPDSLQVIEYPNDILNTKSRLVTNDFAKIEDFQQLILDMEKTMVSMGALGLAAIQVGVPIQLMLVRDNKNVYKMVNPSITKVSSEMDYVKEGCLSFPGVFVRIRRPSFVEVKYLDENGNPQTLQATGMLARAIMHEKDHLDGKVFTTHMNSMEKEKVTKTLKKFR